MTRRIVDTCRDLRIQVISRDGGLIAKTRTANVEWYSPEAYASASPVALAIAVERFFVRFDPHRRRWHEEIGSHASPEVAAIVRNEMRRVFRYIWTDRPEGVAARVRAEER